MDPINSQNIAPQTPISYATPNPTPIPDVSNLYTTPPLTPTGPEQEASAYSRYLEGLNNSLIGKSAFTTAQENQAGIPQLTQQQNDLSGQLSSLANEAKAIPNQLQLDATGRDITAGGLAPIQSAALRENSIKALGVSAMLDATKGLLATAQDKVNRAVAAQYDPIQEKIDAATANLKLILNSPDYSLADKNRAQQQLDIQNQQKAELDQQKQEKTDIYNIMLEASKNGADASTLQKIQNSQTAQEAITNAGASLQPQKQNQIVKLDNGNTVVVDPNTGAIIKNIGGSTRGGADQLIPLDNGQGGSVNVPLSVAPYYNASSDGGGYVDASALQGTAAEKSQMISTAQKAGLRVITNKNESADLTNIQNAYSNLDTIQQTLTGLAAPSALARATYSSLGSGAAQFLETDPRKAAASTLNDTALDLFKAISGIQGFRGGQSMINQIKESLPSIYDTQDTVNQKINTIRSLIQNRENAILGKNSAPASDESYTNITPPAISTAGSTYNGIRLPY